MKELKDYLCLYRNQKVLVTESTGYTYEDDIDAMIFDESVNLRVFGDYYFDDNNDCSIQLILRPLSDMTDKEKEEEIRISDDRKDDDYEKRKPSARGITYLLSKGFDLFGLIESGLAIDKTTLA